MPVLGTSVHPSVPLSVHPSACPSIHADASSAQPRPAFANAKFNPQLLHQTLVFSGRSLELLSWKPLRAAGQGSHPCSELCSISKLF